MSDLKVLVLDTETGGTEPGQPLIEFGAILYNVTQQSAEKIFSCLIPSEKNDAVHINHISLELLASSTFDPADLAMLESLASKADIFAAHNSEFDKGFIFRKWPWWPDKPWLDTLDIEWPNESRHRDLASICLAHGLSVDGTQLHRAMADCQMITRLFDRMTDLSGMIEKAMQPRAKFMAIVSYDARQLAKDAGFEWEGSTKRWLKSLPVDETGKYAFPIRRVG